MNTFDFWLLVIDSRSITAGVFLFVWAQNALGQSDCWIHYLYGLKNALGQSDGRIYKSVVS